MNLNIKATNITLQPETEAYLTKKLESLNHFIDLENDSVFAQVELGKTTRHHRGGDVFRAEINLRSDGHSFRAVAEKDDLHAAIDEMKDELAREVKKGKEKFMAKVKRGGAEAKDAIRNSGETEA